LKKQKERELIVDMPQTQFKHTPSFRHILPLFAEEINQGLPEMSLRAILFISF